jgi:hypothetical protein
VRFLDYLLENVQPAVIAAKAGLLVNVPAPARFALHKLVTAVRRIAAFQSKSIKDVAQADQLLRVLIRDRPGDLRRAWTAATKQPQKFSQQLRMGMARLPDDSRAGLVRIVN